MQQLSNTQGQVKPMRYESQRANAQELWQRAVKQLDWAIENLDQAAAMIVEPGAARRGLLAAAETALWLALRRER